MADLTVTPVEQNNIAKGTAADAGKKLASDAKIENKVGSIFSDADEAAKDAVKDAGTERHYEVPEPEKAGKKGFFGKFLDKLKDFKQKVVMKFKKTKAGKAAEKAGEAARKTGSKLTKTKGGKAGLIAAGVGALLVGIGLLLKKVLGGDEKDNKTEKPEAQKQEGTQPAKQDEPKAEEKEDPAKPAVPDTPEDGEEVEVTIEPQEPVVKGTHKVIKGETIDKMVRDEMAKQGIEEPTDKQVKTAKKAFIKMNEDIVKTYHGVKKEWHGNKFFYPDDEVKFPDFAAQEAA